jgi:hypothetical protein
LLAGAFLATAFFAGAFLPTGFLVDFAMCWRLFAYYLRVCEGCPGTQSIETGPVAAE